MGMCGVIGFDHYLVGNVTQSYLNTKVVVPLAAGGSKTIDLLTAGSGLTLAYAVANDPFDGRPAAKMTVVSGVGDNPLSGFGWAPSGIMVPINDNTLPRTGTWVLGCWIGSSPTRLYTPARGLAGYVSYGSAQQAASLGNNQSGYVEIVVDWTAATATVYLDGVVAVTWTGITTSVNTPIVIGATRYAVSATGGWNWTAIGNNDFMYFRDIYFAINPTGDSAPVSRLGKSRVVAHPVASVSGTRWGTSLPSGDKVAALNTKLDSALTPVVNSSPLNDVGIAKFSAMDVPGNYSDPLYVQVDYAVTMDPGAGVKFVHQVGANAAVTEPLTAGTVTHFVERTTARTQADIAALEVKMNSIPS